jgi:cytochrome c5
VRFLAEEEYNRTNGTAIHSKFMKRQKLFLWGAAALIIACLSGPGLTPIQAQPVSGADSASSPTNSVETSAKAPDAQSAVVKKQLTGAELYSMHCNRCHPERYPTERTAAQWKTIMLHMQIRANIPGEQARLILKYLQDNSGR